MGNSSSSRAPRRKCAACTRVTTGALLCGQCARSYERSLAKHGGDAARVWAAKRGRQREQCMTCAAERLMRAIFAEVQIVTLSERDIRWTRDLPKTPGWYHMRTKARTQLVLVAPNRKVRGLALDWRDWWATLDGEYIRKRQPEWSETPIPLEEP